MAKSKNFPIVILGMHRSGTSVVSNMLHRIGISMGSNLLPSDGFNPNGYFEDEDFLWINKGILENAEGTWYVPPTVEEMIKGGEKFADAICKTVEDKRKKAGRNLWGWKDPRNSLTCWSYMKEIPDARFIVVVRNLADIKLSLNKTHGCLANWEEVTSAYYKSIEQFLQLYANLSLNVCFEELVHRKYAKNAVREVLNFVEHPRKTLDQAMSVIQFR